MKNKSARGLTGIIFATFIPLLAATASLGYYYGQHQYKVPMIATALLGHMKLMAANIKYQKSDLGRYPASLKAMMDADKYFQPRGNSGDLQALPAARGEWHGPYFEKYPDFSPMSQTRRYFEINLKNIYPGLTGSLIANKHNNKKVKYVVTWAAEQSDPQLNEIFEYVLKKCNRENDAMTVAGYAYTLAAGTAYKPCGYLSSFGDIVEINYYVGDAV